MMHDPTLQRITPNASLASGSTSLSRVWQAQTVCVCGDTTSHSQTQHHSVCTAYVANRIGSKLFYTLFFAGPSSFVIYLSYMDISWSAEYYINSCEQRSIVLELYSSDFETALLLDGHYMQFCVCFTFIVLHLYYCQLCQCGTLTANFPMRNVPMNHCPRSLKERNMCSALLPHTSRYGHYCIKYGICCV